MTSLDTNRRSFVDVMLNKFSVPCQTTSVNEKTNDTDQ